MKLFGCFALAAVAPYVVDAKSAVRGMFKENETQQEIRELKKSGGGGGGGGSGDGGQSGNGGSTGGEGVASDCPNFMKGWPSGVKNCEPDGNAGCAGPCGGSVSETCCCVASNGYNYCGNPADCNDWTQCVADPNPPVSSSTNEAEETIKIYENKNGDEVIEAGNVKVSVAQDGKETITIGSHNNVRGEAIHHGIASTHKKVQNLQVANTPTKAADCPLPTDLFVKLRIKVDKEFDDHGKYILDDDDDDDDSSNIWKEDSFDEGEEINRYECLPRDQCYSFEIYGGGHAFDPDKDGSAKLWVDNGNGVLRRLICLNAESTNSPDCPRGEFETGRTWFGCDCKEYGGYSGGCPGVSSGDLGMNFVNPSACPENTLCDVGDQGNPKSVFPLGRCQGDCDDNDDCQGTMICYQRDDFEPVPGCDGNGSKDSDYCIAVVETETHHVATSHHVGTSHHHHTGN